MYQIVDRFCIQTPLKNVPKGQMPYQIPDQSFEAESFWKLTATLCLPTGSQKVSIFPNPSSNSLVVVGLDNTENYEIYSAIGQKIAIGQVSNNIVIDIQNLSNGLYFLNLGNKRTLKFIKE